MYITLILLAIFVCCIATLWTEGLWGNAIRLINVITAALLATNYFEPLADWAQGDPVVGNNFYTFTYVWDFLILWGLFVVFLVVFRLATDRLSRVRLKFLKPVNQAGSLFFAAWIGWIMVCFTAVSLHVAPLGRNFLVKSFVPEQRAAKMFSPEICWLGFVQTESKGAFRRSPKSLQQSIAKKKAKGKWNELAQGNWSAEKYRTFDPQGTFLPKYTTRRANLEYYNKEHSAIRINPTIPD